MEGKGVPGRGSCKSIQLAEKERWQLTPEAMVCLASVLVRLSQSWSRGRGRTSGAS